jgi:lambda repressor-like predicted transcriptional regulator
LLYAWRKERVFPARGPETREQSDLCEPPSELSGVPTARLAGVCAVTGAAGTATAANRAGLVGLTTLAASPHAIAEGKVWLLLTSGVVADRPWLPSLLGFAIVAFAVLSLAPLRVVIAAALGGQVLATLLVYGFLGGARLVDADAFSALLDAPDIGLSAIIAAWIGVIAAVLWRRHRTPQAHVFVCLGCIACVFIGLAFRPNLTVLDSEHLVAFALGAATLVLWPERHSDADLDRELAELLAS